MTISDEYINRLFEGTNFGATINECIEAKKALLVKNLKAQMAGYWSGHTVYSILKIGGFIVDAKSSTEKVPTLLGRDFLKQQGNDRFGSRLCENSFK